MNLAKLEERGRKLTVGKLPLGISCDYSYSIARYANSTIRHTGEGRYPSVSRVQAATWTPDQVRGDSFGVLIGARMAFRSDPLESLIFYG